ncbi:hypothetical protein V8F20_006396 [Naviculisporaceae sp. PSN 640]
MINRSGVYVGSSSYRNLTTGSRSPGDNNKEVPRLDDIDSRLKERERFLFRLHRKRSSMEQARRGTLPEPFDFGDRDQAVKSSSPCSSSRRSTTSVDGPPIFRHHNSHSEQPNYREQIPGVDRVRGEGGQVSSGGVVFTRDDVQCSDWDRDTVMGNLTGHQKQYLQAPFGRIGKQVFGGALGLWICSGISLAFGVSAQHTVPGLITHIAAGTSIAASIMFPPLRNGGDLVQPGRLLPAVYGTWGVAFVTLLVCELLRRPTGLQRRLLVGTVLFSSLNLLGTLSQSAPSTLEGVMSWGPMALTASLCVIPVAMDMVSPRSAAEMVVNMAGVHLPVQPRRVYQGQ